MTRQCTVLGCGRPHCAKGYCNSHYARAKRGLDPNVPIHPYGDPEARYWKKVDKSDECWLWTGSLDGNGYGTFFLDGRVRRAHRVSYAWKVGPIPDGMEVDHVCRIRNCVKPAHLRAVTRAENTQNLGLKVGSRSGVRGVYWHSRDNCWVASAGLAGENIHLGYFSTVAEAEAVVVAWRRENMPFSEMDKVKEAP